MRLHRFYTTEDLTVELSYTNSEHLHQWRNVFRYTEGDRVILFGDGLEHEYRIISIDKKVAHLKQTNTRKSILQEKPLTIALALIKKENFEVAISKCTEIGVTRFIPLITDRSLQKMYGRERLEKIVTEAVEQSGWGSIPVVEEPVRFDDILSKKTVVFDMTGETLESIDTGNIFCIGPEGGWSDRELELAKNMCTVAKLNTGVLRSETGAIVISGIIKNT